MSPMQNRGEKLELGPSAGPQVPRQVDDRHKGLLRSLGSCRKQSTTGPWAMLEFNTEATRPSQRESHQTFSERKTRHFSTRLMEEGAIILKIGCLPLLSAWCDLELEKQWRFWPTLGKTYADILCTSQN